jgi:hypothetical protein
MTQEVERLLSKHEAGSSKLSTMKQTNKKHQNFFVLLLKQVDFWGCQVERIYFACEGLNSGDQSEILWAWILCPTKTYVETYSSVQQYQKVAPLGAHYFRRAELLWMLLVPLQKKSKGGHSPFHQVGTEQEGAVYKEEGPHQILYLPEFLYLHNCEQYISVFINTPL